MRVAFLTNIVSPYRKPVFERLAATPGWTFRVFANAASEFDRSWQVDLGTLDVSAPSTISIPRRVRSTEPIPFEQVITLHLPVGLWSALAEFRPDVVISLELGPRSLVAASFCAVHGIPLVLWSYQSRVSATQGHPLRRRVRRWLLRRADQVVGMGQQAREVLEAWGAPPGRIVDAPNACDTDTMVCRLRDSDATARVAAVRARAGAGRRLALVPGRLVPLKGTSSILDAWAALDPEVRAGWRLVFVGHGPLEPLVRQARPLGVELAGAVPAHEMADWYAAADLCIFPSLGDVWGLVANEAMTCGAAVLCSIHAGCCDELVEHGRTGLAFDPADPTDAVPKLRDALTRTDLHTIAEEGRRHVTGFSPDRMADRFRLAVARAVQARPAATGDWAAELG